MNTKDPLITATVKVLSEAVNLKAFNDGITYVGTCVGCDTRYTVQPGSRYTGGGLAYGTYRCAFCGSTYLRFKEE